MLVSVAIEVFITYLQTSGRSPETQRGYRISLISFNRFLESQFNGPGYIDEIELSHLEGYLTYRKVQGDQAVSRNRLLSIIRSFYNYLTKRELVARDISLKLEPIRVQQKERLHLDQSEVDILVESIRHPIVKAAVKTLAYTGLRVSELCHLKLDDVDLDRGIIKVIAGKGNKDRLVPMCAKLKAILQEYLHNTRPVADTDLFFATEKTGQLSPVYVNRILKQATDELGWSKHVTAHILRHSFASNLVRSKAPLVAIQKILGHSDLRMTSHYLHQNMIELQDAVNLLQ